MRLFAWSATDPGRKRDRNEDNHLVDVELGLLAVADGMGGHQGGATASRMVLDLLQKDLRTTKIDVSRLAASGTTGLEDTDRHQRLRTTEPMPIHDPMVHGTVRGDSPTADPVAPGAAATEPSVVLVGGGARPA
jgi:hypothetical protein